MEGSLCPDDRGKLSLPPLEKATPAEGEQLSLHVYTMLPQVMLPELLLDLNNWSGFLRPLTHLTSRDAPVGNDTLVLVTALMDMGMNLGLITMQQSRPFPSLASRWRSWLQDAIQVFLSDLAVPCDDTVAQRDCRTIAVQQNVSGTLRRYEGTVSCARIRGSLSTMRMHDALIAAALASPLRGHRLLPSFSATWLVLLCSLRKSDVAQSAEHMHCSSQNYYTALPLHGLAEPTEAKRTQQYSLSPCEVVQILQIESVPGPFYGWIYRVAPFAERKLWVK